LSLVSISTVAAYGGNTDTSPEGTFATPPVPYMVLYHQEASVAGLQTNLCWPEGQGNVSCEPTFGDLQPNEALTVSKDDTINIGFGDAEAPDEVVVKSGSIELTFRANEQPQIPMNLFNDGRNTLEITAYYTDVAGSQAAVSSLFAVEVGTAVASNPTPASEDGTVETPVAEVTSEGVVDSTPDTSDTGTDETPAPEVTSEG